MESSDDDAVQRPLKSTPLTSIKYSLFVPKKLSPGVNAENIRKRLALIPLATAMGGTFRETLEMGAGKLGWPLEIARTARWVHPDTFRALPLW